MNQHLINIVPAIPEIFVLVMACAILLLGIFIKWRDLTYYLVQLTLIVAALLSWYTFAGLDGGSKVLIFHQSFVLDRLAFVLKEFVYVAAFMSFWYAKQYNEGHRLPQHEFYVLGLLSTLGMMVLVSAHNLLTLYLGLELMSLPLYAMVALARSKVRAIEAGMKYFVFGALASGLLLYGFSMLFGATKSLDIGTIATVLKTVPLQDNLMLVFSLVFIMAGLAFKLGAAPFHMWVPDVYDGSPNSVTVFLSSAPKLAAFGLIIRILVDAMPHLNIEWEHIWIVVGLLSIVIGNVVAIAQTNIKRMLAYSSIAHMGYMILGLAIDTSRGDAAALFYIISYTIMTLGSFGMVAMMSRTGIETNELSHFAGLNRRNPWLAFLMLVIMFSMAGIPPLVGFIAKVGIFEALINAHVVWLAVVAILFAIVGSYYYLRLVKIMYFEDGEEHEPIQCPINLNIALSVNSLAVLVLGIFPGWLFAMSHLMF